MSEKKPFDWKKLLEPLKRYQYALLILLVGLVLLAWPDAAVTKQETTAQATSGETADAFDLTAMETRLAESLAQIDGVGETEVVLTLSAGSETVLATDWEADGDSSSVTTVVISNGSSQQTTVTTQVIYPTFQGALVVCDGGDSATVRLQVVKAVAALTGLGADSISVCARTGGNE